MSQFVSLIQRPSSWLADPRERPADDPIFALNQEAAKRAARGEAIVNATLGALLEDSGQLAVLPSVAEAFAHVDARRAAAYAPIAGEPRFLAAVLRDLFGTRELAQHALAVATPGGTGALHAAVVSFLEPGQALLTTQWYWSPYQTIAEHTRRRVATFAMFDARGRFQADAFERALRGQVREQGRALVVINTPCHNPTGFTFDEREWSDLAAALSALASDAPIALCLDLAYSRFAPGDPNAWAAHVERLTGDVLVLAAWSASKSFAQYGARIGALVAVHPDAAERKRIHSALTFACRGTWSNCNHLGQLAITELLTDAALAARVEVERERLRGLLFERVEVFNHHARAAGLTFPRYEGGFFVTVFCERSAAAAERAREQGVFVVPLEGGLRVALCSTPVRDVPRLVSVLAQSIA